MPDPYWEKVRQDAERSRAERALGSSKGHPSSKGKRKWKCADCQLEQLEHWIIQDRAARPRCPGCGSLRYEMKSPAAKADAADLKDVRKSYHGPKGTGAGPFVIGGGK